MRLPNQRVSSKERKVIIADEALSLIAGHRPWDVIESAIQRIFYPVDGTLAETNWDEWVLQYEEALHKASRLDNVIHNVIALELAQGVVKELKKRVSAKEARLEARRERRRQAKVAA